MGILRAIMRPIKLVVYESDCQVFYSHSGYCDPPMGEKKDITEFTKESRRRLAFVAANTSVLFAVMITLTYPKEFPTNGETVKLHLKRFKESLLRRFPAEYLWCLEFQKRGAPHCHILLDNPDPLKDRLWVSKRWYEIVGSKDHKHLLAGTRTERLRSKEGGKRYIVKYTAKMRQKIVPAEYAKVGRFWGHSRKVKPMEIGTIELGGEKAFWELIKNWDRAKSIKLPLKTLFNASESIQDVTNNRTSLHEANL